MKKFLTLCFLACLYSTVYSQVQRPTPPPANPEDNVVKISTSLIQVDVTVTDAKGNAVTDLKRSDFEIFENGERQRLSSFAFVSGGVAERPQQAKRVEDNVPAPPPSARPERIRRTFALIVDDLLLSFESVYHTKRALKRFVDEQMQDGDLVAIIRTGGGIGALQQFTTDKRQLYAAIERVRWNPNGRGRTGVFEAIEPTPQEILRATGDTSVSDEDIEEEKNKIRSFDDFRDSTFATGTLGALKYIVGGMRDLPGRKSVVMFSDGFSLLEVDSQGFSDFGRIIEFLREVVDTANRSSVVFYTIDARGLQTTSVTARDKILSPNPQNIQAVTSGRSGELLDTQAGLAYLAEETGGIAIRNVNDLSYGVRRVLNDQSYYLIGYEPDSETFDAEKRKFNKLDIKVNRPGVTVRYRSGFFNVPTENVASAASNTTLTPVQQLRSALASPFGVNDISLSLNPIFGNDQVNGSYVRSLLHVNGRDLTFVDQPDGTKKVAFDVLATSFGDNGVPVDQLGKSYTVDVSAPGYQRILREGFVYHFTFPVTRPGAYQYRVAIRDTSSGKIGSANKFLEVPDLKKQRLALSSLLLQNLTTSQWDKLGAGRQISADDPLSSPMNDTSLRRFKMGTIVQYGFEIYNARLAAGGRPELNTRIRVFRDGQVVLDGETLPVDVSQQTDLQRIRAGGAISLTDKMPAGDYVLQVIVTDLAVKQKPRISSQYVEFEVVQ